MFYVLISRVVLSDSIAFGSSYNKLRYKQVEHNGVLVRSSVFERFDNAAELSKFNVNDFKLDNILALGAYDMLKPSVMTDTSPLTTIQNVENVIRMQFPNKSNSAA